MVYKKSPYTGNAAAQREHARLIRKGKAIAESMRIARCIAMIEDLIKTLNAEESEIALRYRRSTSMEQGSPWSTPAQAPYCDGFHPPGQTSDIDGGSK